MYKRKARILFLGSENLGFSQMAEGYALVLGKDWIEPRSAGINSCKKNTNAVVMMQEDGIDISALNCVKITAELLQWADLVVTLSGLAEEHSPEIPSHVRKKHWPLPDINETTCSDAEVMLQFRTVRDEIKRRVASMIGGLKMMGNH